MAYLCSYLVSYLLKITFYFILALNAKIEVRILKYISKNMYLWRIPVPYSIYLRKLNSLKDYILFYF